MKKGQTYPRCPVTEAARKRPVSYRLSAPFCRCPVCGGTTSMDSYHHGVPSSLNSVCYSCDTRWDLHGEVISMGSITRMPFIESKENPPEELH